MTAYLFANIEQIHDGKLMSEYGQLTAPTMDKYGGKLIANTSPPEVLEGQWNGLRTLIFEFPSMDALESWYNSEEYKPLILMRQKAADVTVLKIGSVK